MIPKTQSVCKHCQQQILECTATRPDSTGQCKGYIHTATGSHFCERGVAEPASTGEPLESFGDPWGGPDSTGNEPAARPSEPSAPPRGFDPRPDLNWPLRSMRPAPQTSAELQNKCDFCRDGDKPTEDGFHTGIVNDYKCRNAAPQPVSDPAPSPTPSVSTEPGSAPQSAMEFFNAPIERGGYKGWTRELDKLGFDGKQELFAFAETYHASLPAAPSVAGTQPTCKVCNLPKFNVWSTAPPGTMIYDLPKYFCNCMDGGTWGLSNLPAQQMTAHSGTVNPGAAQGTPQVEEISREIAEKLAAMHLIVWQGLGQAMDEYAKETSAILRKHGVGAPAQPGPEEKK